MSTLIQLSATGTTTNSANKLQHNVKYGEAINKGQAVYVSSADGTNIVVSKADYSTEGTSSKTMGLVLATGALNYQGIVVTEGLLAGTGGAPLNTSTATIGDPVWLGANGNLIFGLINKPYAPKHLVFIGIVTRVSATVGEIFVKVQNGFELDEIHDVQLKGTGNVPTDGQVLTYDALTGLWKAKSVVNEQDAPLIFVMAATEGALVNTPTYYNGLTNDGVGATLTSVGNVVLSDNSAIGRIDTNYIPDTGDLILVKNQVDQRQNGVYEITQIGSGSTPYILTRSVDVDAPVELFPLQINAFQGLVNGSKYFTQANTLWGDAIPPVIGGSAPNSNIIFALTSLTTAPLQITFVDHVTIAALPTCVYTLGTDVTKPGVGATLTASAAGLLTLSGMSAASTTGALNTFNTILVRNQAEPRHNGTYQVINPGSTTARWVLQRIDNLAAGFNKALRIVFCSHNVSPFAGSYYTPSWNPTLLNKNVGVTVGIPTVATNQINYVGFTPQNGRFGIANSNGAYTYYTTLQSAINAAVAGQTVEVFSDFTETGSVTITLKNGVNINGNGHTYTLSVNNGTNAFTFALSGTVELYNLKVVRTGRTVGTGTGYVLSFQDANAKIKCFNTSFLNDFGYCCVGTGIIYNAHGLGYLDGMYDGLGNVRVYDSYFESTGTGTAINTPVGFLYNSTGKAVSGNGISCNGEVYECTGISSSGIGISAQRITKCTGLSTSGTGLSGEGRNCVGISTSGIGGSGTFYNSTLISSSNYGCQATLYNSYTQSSSSVATNSSNIYNSTVRCLWNNIGGHCTSTNAAGAKDILNSFLEVTNASAYCINGYPGSTWKYAANTYKGSTTAVNSTNIIQGITNTSDNQGNILI